MNVIFSANIFKFIKHAWLHISSIHKISIHVFVKKEKGKGKRKRIHVVRISNHKKNSFFPLELYLKRFFQRATEKTFSLIDYKPANNSTDPDASAIQTLFILQKKKEKRKRKKSSRKKYSKTLATVEIHGVNSRRAVVIINDRWPGKANFSGA